MSKLLALFCVVFIDSLGMGLVFPLLGPIFFDQAHYFSLSLFQTNFYYALTLSLYPLGMFFAAPLLGDLSDYIGRKKVLLLCLIGESLGYFMCAAALLWHHALLLALSRLLGGLFAGSMSVAQAAVLDGRANDEKSKYLGTLLAITCFGFIAGPLMAGIFSHPALVSWFSWWTPFMVAGLLGLANSLLLWLAFKDTHSPRNGFVLNIRKAIQLFSAGFTDIQIRHISILFVLIESCWAIYTQFLPLVFLSTLHSNSYAIGWFFGLSGLWLAITFIGITPILTARFSTKNVLIIALLMNLIGASTSQFFNWPCLLIGNFFFSIGNGMAYSALLTLISNNISTERQGWAMGIAGSMTAVTFAIAAMVGMFLETLGTHGAFGFFFLLALLGIFWAGYMFSKHSLRH